MKILVFLNLLLLICTITINEVRKLKTLNPEFGTTKNIEYSKLHSKEWNQQYSRLLNQKNHILRVNQSNSTFTLTGNLTSDNDKDKSKLDQFLINLFLLYLSTLLIFTFLALFKYLEEVHLIKEIYIKNKFESFIEIKDNITNHISFKNKNVFSTGKIVKESIPRDDVFSQFYEENNCIFVSRLIEIFDKETTNSHFYCHRDVKKIRTNFIKGTNIYQLKLNNGSDGKAGKIDVEFSSIIMPSFFASNCSLNGIALSNQQLKLLISNSKLKLKFTNEAQIEEFSVEKNLKKVTFEKGEALVIPSLNFPERFEAKIYLQSVVFLF